MRGPTSIAFWGGFAFVVGARYTVFSVLACIFIFRPANPDAGYLLLWAFMAVYLVLYAVLFAFAYLRFAWNRKRGALPESWAQLEGWKRGVTAAEIGMGFYVQRAE